MGSLDLSCTNNEIVNELLNAIEEANSYFHNSEHWNDEATHNYLDGNSPAEWISLKAQEIANKLNEANNAKSK